MSLVDFFHLNTSYAAALLQNRIGYFVNIFMSQTVWSSNNRNCQISRTRKSQHFPASARFVFESITEVGYLIGTAKRCFNSNALSQKKS